MCPDLGRKKGALMNLFFKFSGLAIIVVGLVFSQTLNAEGTADSATPTGVAPAPAMPVDAGANSSPKAKKVAKAKKHHKKGKKGKKK
jgi:hypothetical protein